jgi:phospholipid-translocating ATPase
MFWFQLFNGFDATYLFEYTLLLLYNLVFTSLPVGILGALDQDTNAAASLAFPQLYRRGMMGLDYTRTRFWLYMADGLYQSAILFFIPMLCYGSGHSWASDGKDTNSLYDLGTTIAVAGVFVANLYTGINTRYWTVITWVVYVGSTLLVYIWIPIYSALATFPYYGEAEVIYPTFNFWFIVFFTVFCCVGPRWIIVTFRNSYFPRDKDIIREAWVAGDLKRELGLKRRRQIKAEKKHQSVLDELHHPHTHGHGHGRNESIHDSTSDHSHEHDAERAGGSYNTYEYEPAGMSSPLRDRPRSPLQSETGTPRGPFSYPPSPANPFPIPAHLASPRSSVPPPLLLKRDSDPKISSPLSTPPATGIAYTSPTAIETMTLAQDEIKRMSRNSTELRRSSLTVPPPRPALGSRTSSAGSGTTSPPWLPDNQQSLSRNGSSRGTRRQSPPFGTEGNNSRGSYPLEPIISNDPPRDIESPRGTRQDLHQYEDATWDRDQQAIQGTKRESTASGAGYGYAV